MRQTLKVTVRQHRGAALACAAAAFALALTVGLALPPIYRVDAQLHVRERSATQRLTNPFSSLVDENAELKEAPEQMFSQANLTAMVKRTGLVDQWAASRSPLLKVKDRLLELVLGPPSEEALLEALVQMVEKRLTVDVDGRNVSLGVEWSSAEGAKALCDAAVYNFTHRRVDRQLDAVRDGMRVLNERLSNLQAEAKARAKRIEAEVKAAETEYRPPNIGEDREALDQALFRTQDIIVRLEEQRLEEEIITRSRDHTYLVIKPSQLPKKPLSSGPWVALVLAVIAALAAGCAGPLVLGLASGRALSALQLHWATGMPVLADLQAPFSFEPLRKSRVAVAVAAALTLATGVTAGIGRGNPVLALAPVLAATGLYAIWHLPIKWPLLGLMLVAVTCDDPQDRPYWGLWRSPTWAIGKLFFTNVAFFSGFELALMGLVGVMLMRRIFGSHLDPLKDQPPKVLRYAVLFSAATIGWLTVMGVARGGEFRQALWQFRYLLFLPVIAWLAMQAFEFPKDTRKIGTLLVGGSLLKAVFGTYFMYRIAFPMAEYPPHTTGHNDTMVFVCAVLFMVILLWEKPTWRHVVPFLLWLPFIAMALKLNDRRIAYVDIVIALVVVFVISPLHRAKRFAVRAMAAMAPVVVVYLAAGWNHEGSGFFGPAAKVRSIVAPQEGSEEDSSNVERDIENYNLMKSWEANMFIGQGFGHAFTEFVPSNDFAQSNFGHTGHNSILWVWWIGGLFGFTGVFLYLAITALLLGRTLPRTPHFKERLGLLLSLGAILTYLLQAFGDMGTQSIQLDFFVATAVAYIGRLATRNGALVPVRESESDREAQPITDQVVIPA